MADQLLETVRDALEGQIDFEGQRLAELITYSLLSVAGLVAFVLGFLTQNIYNILWVGLGGTALTFVAVVPPWPFFNKHPVNWLPSPNSVRALNIEVDGKKVS